MRRPDKYKLEGYTPVPWPEDDVLGWAAWYEDSRNRMLARDRVGDLLVSTIFLGLDHNYDEGPPILFETMILSVDPETGRHYDRGFQKRASTWDEGLAHHAEALALARRWQAEETRRS